MTYFELLALMVFAHFLADYPLQGTWIATTKSHKDPHPSGYPWYQSLTAHAAIHGGFIGLITGSLWFACAEFFIHWVIDYEKSDGAFGVNVDQTLHIICKIIFAYAAIHLLDF